MTSDEMNRAMEFILQQEAQLSVRMGELAKQMQEPSELHKRDHGLLVQMAVQEQRMSELLQITALCLQAVLLAWFDREAKQWSIGRICCEGTDGNRSCGIEPVILND